MPLPRRLASLPVLMAVLAACHHAPPPLTLTTPPAADTLALGDRRALVSAMDRMVRRDFAHWQGLVEPYDTIVARFRDRAARSASRRDFDFAAMEFAASLRNGHTRFADQWLDSTRDHPRWFTLAPVAEGWVVRGSRVEGLERGALVTAIDDVPTDSMYARHAKYLAQSGERLRRRSWTGHDELFGDTTRLTTGDGRTFVVDRAPLATPAAAAGATSAPTVLIPHRWLVPDSIAYVRVGRFSPNAYEDSAVAIIRREYSAAPALVLDVRENGGGNTPNGLITYLMNGVPMRDMRIESSTIRGDRLAFMQRYARRPDHSGYAGRLVIVANAGCASSCEDLVAPFADNHRATIVGDTTWGSTGQPRFVDFGNGMRFQVSARRYLLADGRAFEGVGIAPDVVVSLGLADYRSPGDRTLDRAIGVARTMLDSARVR